MRGLVGAAALGAALAVALVAAPRPDPRPAPPLDRPAPRLDPPPCFSPVDLDALIAFHEKQAARDPLDPRPRAQLASAFLEKARETGDAGHYLRAERSAREALANDPAPDAPVRAVLARLALAAHDFPSAIEIAEGLRAARPRDPEPLAVLFDAHHALGDAKEAAALADELVRLGETAGALARRAQARLLEGRESEAGRDLEAALGADDGRSREASASLRVLYGDAQASAGRLAEAGAAYEAALRCLPGYPAARVRLEAPDPRAVIRAEQAAARAAGVARRPGASPPSASR